MTELKPCPFCGGNALSGDTSKHYNEYLVWCTRCGAETDVQDTRAEAISAWNRRAGGENG